MATKVSRPSLVKNKNPIARNVISIRGKAMVKSGKESVLSADALKIAGTDRQKLEGLSAYFPTQKHVV